MAMGRRRRKRQRSIWVEEESLARSPGHPFYERLNAVLEEAGFDAYVEGLCEPFYAGNVGRPSLPPAVYFRLLLIGYFEGIDSERGIAWRVADSLTLREFVGYALSQAPPDHSTISRNRRLLDLESHQAVFAWVVGVLAKHGLVRGKTLGVDATTLEANAALRSIVRRDSGESYEEFLVRLAKASGIETPTREDLAKIDRNRPGKGSNDDWQHPHDPDARITKMKDGRTHLAHKASHTVDMETGAVVGVRVDSAAAGDTQTVEEGIEDVVDNLAQVMEDPEAAEQLSDELTAELVADKGYHSNAVLKHCRNLGIRTYISEPDRGRRNWKGKAHGEGGDVRESAPDEARQGSAIAAAPRRADRTQLRAQLRDRRPAKDAPAGPLEHPQTAPDPSRRLQSESRHAPSARGRHPPGPPGPSGGPCGAPAALARAATAPSPPPRAAREPPPTPRCSLRADGSPGSMPRRTSLHHGLLGRRRPTDVRSTETSANGSKTTSSEPGTSR